MNINKFGRGGKTIASLSTPGLLMSTESTLKIKVPSF